ncbi:hypothetical protein Q5752_006086 [Cryptotrichosporon argae]
MAHHYSHPGTSNSPTLIPPSHHFHTPTPAIPFSSPLAYHTETSTLSPASLSPGPSTHFGSYPGSLPTQSAFLSAGPLSYPTLFTTSVLSGPRDDKAETSNDLELDMGFDRDFDPLESHETLLSLEDVQPSTPAPARAPSLTASPSSKRPVQPPRPPNAWILYRSDKLKAIAAGEQLPNLDSLLAESGVSGGSVSASSGEESGTDARPLTDGAGNVSSTAPSSQVPSPDAPGAGATPKKKKKAKKGAKEPTEGMLALGKGKSGRGLPQTDISKMISMLWKREAPEVRAKYDRLSELRKLEHLEKYPGYKFQPLRKAEKLKMREEREREREAAKQEKELQRSATRGNRRSRARTRVSPISLPYSSRPAPLGRSLSYGARSPAGAIPGPGMFLADAGAMLTDSNDEDTLRSYPFPIPATALPSMKPGDHTDNPYIDVGIGTGSAGVLSSSLQRQHGGGTSEREPQQWIGPPPAPPHMYPGGPLDMPPVPGWADIQGQGVAYAMPYIFEPIPIPGDDVGASILDRLNNDQGSVDELAATWCLLEEESTPGASGGNAPAGPGPSTSNFSHDGLFRWDADPTTAVERWHSLDASGDNFGSLGLTSSIAEQIAAGWAAQQAEIEHAPMGFYPGVLEPTTGYVNVALNDDGQLAFRSAVGDDGTGGPFLSTSQPLSPLDAWWVAASTPRGHLRHTGTSNVDSREARGSLSVHSPSSPVLRVRSTTFAPPRHVSNSAYPPTPLAGDPTLPLPWDRQPSLPFPEIPDGLATAPEELAWDDEGAHGSAQGSHAVTPTAGHHPAPPRGVRRGRAVAAQFAPTN